MTLPTLATLRLRSAALPALCSAVLAALAAWQPAQAASMNVGAQICYVDVGQTCYQDSRTSPMEVGVQVNDGPNYASVVQDWGVFHADAMVSFSGRVTPGHGEGVRATAGGTTVDTWTLGGHTGMGYLKLIWTVTGATQTSGSGPGYSSTAFLDLDVTTYAKMPENTSANGYATTGPLYGGRTVEMQGTIPFWFGLPIRVTTSDYVYVSTGTDDSYIGTSFSGLAQASFGHTAVLTGIVAYDPQGQALDNLSISAESGTNYPLSPVPEPASAWLLAVGAAALLGRRALRGGASA